MRMEGGTLMGVVTANHMQSGALWKLGHKVVGIVAGLWGKIKFDLVQIVGSWIVAVEVVGIEGGFAVFVFGGFDSGHVDVFYFIWSGIISTI